MLTLYSPFWSNVNGVAPQRSRFLHRLVDDPDWRNFARPHLSLWGERETSRSIGHQRVEKTDEGLILELDFPGVEQENIALDLLPEGKVRVEAKRNWSAKTEGDAKDGDVQRETNEQHALREETYSETFTIPDYVDSSAISATYAQGVLRIQFPYKAEEHPEKVQRIPIASPH